MTTIDTTPRALTTDDFDQVISRSDQPVLVDFWATWCGPCKMMEPVLEQLAADRGDQAVIAKVNVDEASQLAARFEIRSIPTFIVFKDGQEVERFSGMTSQEELEAKLDPLI